MLIVSLTDVTVCLVLKEAGRGRMCEAVAVADLEVRSFGLSQKETFGT